MFNHRNLMTVCCAAVLAFGLAACGSSDDDTTAEAPEVMEPAGPTQAELDAAEAAAAEAEAARLAAEEALEAEKYKQHRATSAALKKALGDDPLTQLRSDTDTALINVTGAGAQVGLPDADSDTDANPSVLMKAGDSADAINGWEGQNYVHSAAGTVNHALVYTFKNPVKGKAAEIAFAGITGYLVADRLVPLGTDASRDYGGDMFPKAGVMTYDKDTTTEAVSFAGTFQGAPGMYRCIGAAECTATVGTGGVTLAGDWDFIHDEGAYTSTPDDDYQMFGWWLRKDAGAPALASAFFGRGGSGTAVMRNVGADTFVGTASYSGSAAGKFAISDPIGPADSGHFTADVGLTAKFGADVTAGNESGISGTVSNFMANEEAVPWMVTLRRATWGTTGAFATAADTAGTVWSIDGKPAAASGRWNGQTYDDADPSSTTPTVAVGVFQSEFGSTHTMVGGFGARKE